MGQDRPVAFRLAPWISKNAPWRGFGKYEQVDGQSIGHVSCWNAKNLSKIETVIISNGFKIVLSQQCIPKIINNDDNSIPRGQRGYCDTRLGRFWP